MAAGPQRFKLVYCDDAPLVRAITYILRGPTEGWVIVNYPGLKAGA